jgi:hypothetical protein
LAGSLDHDDPSNWEKHFPLVKFTDVKQLLCPVNCGTSHWCLFVVDLVKNTIQALDSLFEKPCQHAIKNLKRFVQLMSEEGDRGLLELPNKMVPKQDNSADCGAFTSMFLLYSAARLEFPTKFFEDSFHTRVFLANLFYETASCLAKWIPQRDEAGYAASASGITEEITAAEDFNDSPIKLLPPPVAVEVEEKELPGIYF